VGAYIGRAILISGLALCIAACADNREDKQSPVETREQACTKLRDHLIDLRLAGFDNDREQHRRALSEAMGSAFVESCKQSFGDDEVACAMQATDDDTARNCFSASSSK